MAESVHDRLQVSELFDGPVDTASFSRWPTWAREHLRVCPSCQALLAAERKLREAARLLADSETRRLRDGPPSPAARKARLAARRPPAIEDLISAMQPLPRQVMRFEGSPLELRRTSQGVRAWHPDALELLVLAAEPDEPSVVLKHHREATPGVGIDLGYQPDKGARVLALASKQPLEPEHWLMWLQDALAAGELAQLVQQSRSSFVHVAEATIPPPLRSSLLRLQDEPLAPARPDVTALLKQASAAGRADNAPLAARRYRQALELAFTRNDATGQIKAGIGISMALSGMGYPDDGDTVLRWVIETHKLDADWASWICQHMATDAMYRVDFDAAQRWADESDAIDAEPKAWGAKVKASIFYYRHEWSTLRKTLRGLAEMELPALQRAHADSLAAVDLAHRGRAKDARRAFDGVELPADVPLEMLLHWKAVGAAIDLGAGLPVDWQEVVLSVTALLRERDGGLLSSWDHLPLLRLVELADEAGSPDAATSLMRLRYLDSARAAGAENRLLGLCRAPSGLLLIEATEAARVDRLRTSQVRFRLLVKEAQRELQSGRSMSAVRQLAELLVPRVEGNTSPVWIGSDGLLAGAPMNAISMVARGERSEGQAFRVLAGHRTPPPSRAAGCTDIVSIADSRGDLPWASREVMRSEASLWARGKAAVKQCLDLEAPCGLLHLGVHSRRELGVPQLMFANGPMGPLDIARLSLPGAPVVLLAGCFTGTAKTDKGVERSLADSFSRAGASAVIATQWAVEDREMHQFVRRVVEAWPFADAASRVAEICCALRSEGLPARCWAAPVVY